MLVRTDNKIYNIFVFDEALSYCGENALMASKAARQHFKHINTLVFIEALRVCFTWRYLLNR